MNRSYRVNLGFNADTRQARAQIEQLQNQLTALVNQPVSIGEKLSSDILKASHAAAELKVHLQNATNVQTGALDFGKLNQSISKSGQSLTHYAEQLSSLGPRGQQAFMSLANAVASAEVPLRRSNALLENFMTTLKNTAKWQISSSMLHGLQSGVQQAFNYAQDLNESLNNIRIVTGQNVDQMARFAKEANAAARALSTTTTEYTNASLIYYQQGLSTQEVKERTDLTIKMANVARVSAEQASDQLTAVWNNFADGTKSLEYYVDVMTALGAKTASSTDEIAGGLEKFAGIANTIGLSYEYATAAIATLTANTRQSEEVVGTALKTIFARIQGLNLGETLEDGVTLNKYSEAMKTVGIDILDQNKNLKTMDTLLNELGAKWDTISKAQQTALAQTVAGTRQYTQLVSLMDNWNKGDEDSFVTNVATARGASGSLQEQADIYAESWEAARDRVTASAEEIYSALFEDEGFIKLTNSFADLLDMVGDFVQSIGGLNGVLTGLGFVMTKVFSKQMAQGFRDVAYNITMSTEAGRRAVQSEKMKVMNDFANQMARHEAAGISEETAKSVYQKELTAQKELLANAERMTEEEKAQYQILLDQSREYGKQAIMMAKMVENAQNNKSDAMSQIYAQAQGHGLFASEKTGLSKISKHIAPLSKAASVLGAVKAEIAAVGTSGEISEKQIEKLKNKIDKLTGVTDDSKNAMKKFLDQMSGAKINEASGAIEKLYGELGGNIEQKINSFMDSTAIDKNDEAYGRLREQLVAFAKEAANVTERQGGLARANKAAAASFEYTTKAIQKAKGVTKDWANHLSTVMSSLMSAGMLISSINGLVDTIKDPNTSGWEKLGGVLTSVSMAAMSVGGTLQGVSAAISLVKSITAKETKEKLLNAAASMIQAKAEDKVNDEKKETGKQTREALKATRKETREKVKNAAAGKLDYNAKAQRYTSNGKFISKEVAGKAMIQQQLPGIGYAGAIIAGLAVIGVTIAGVVAHYQKWNIEAEKAATAAANLKSRYDEVNTSFSEFSQIVDSYDNAKDSLEGLTKGTQEYNKALVEANSSAMELLEKYDSLAGSYTINSDGLIEIDQAALLRAQKEQLRQVQQAQAASLYGNITANNAAQKAKQVDVMRDVNSSSDNWSTVGNAAGGLATGAAGGALVGLGVGGIAAGTAAIATKLGATIGTAITPGLGTAIGAAAGAIIGTVAGVITSETQGAASKAEEEALDKIAEQYKTNSNMFATDKEFRKVLIEDIKLDDQNLINALVANRKAVEELTKAENLRVAKEKSDWKAAFNAANANNDIFAKSEYKDALANLAYNATENGTDGTESFRSQATDTVNDLFKGSNEDFWQRYLELIYGETDVTTAGAGVSGQNVRVRNLGGGAVTLEKFNGETWETVGDKNGLDKDAAQAQLIEAEAARMASAAMETWNTTIEDLTADLTNAGLDAEQEDHKAAIQKILSEFTDKGAIDLTDYAYELVSGMDTSKIGDSNLQAAVNKAKENYLEGLSDLKKQIFEADWYKLLTNEQKQLLWTIEVDQYGSLENVKKAYDALQAYINGKSLVTTIDVASQLTTALSKERKGSKDWDNAEDGTGIKQLYEKLNEENNGALMAWDEFMKLSQQEMIDYVEAVESGAIQGLATVSPQSIKAQQDARDAAEKAYDDRLKNYKHTQGVLIPEAQANLEAANKANPYEGLIFNRLLGLDDLFGRGGNPTLEQAEQFLLQSEGTAWEKTNFLDFLSSEGQEALTEFFVAKRTQDIEAASAAMAKLRASFKTTMSEEQVRSFEGVFNNLYSGIAGTGFAHDMEGLLGFFQQEYGNVIIAPHVTELQDLVEGSIKPTTTAIDDANDKLNTMRQWYQNAIDSQEAYFTSIGLNLEDVNNLAEYLERTNKALEDNQYLSNAVAGSMLRYSNGVKAVADNYDRWLNVLEAGNPAEKGLAMSELAEMYGNLLNIKGSLLSNDILFDTELLGLAQDVAAGKDSAYTELQVRIGQSFLGSAYGANDIFGKNLRQGLYNVINTDKTEGAIVSSNINEGADLYDLYYTAISEAILAGDTEAIAEEKANSFLQSVGWKIAETDDTGEIVSFAKLAEGYQTSALDNADQLEDDQLAEIERYKTINDQLDSIKDKYDDLTKAADRYYGKDRINLLTQANDALKTELVLLGEQKKMYEATDYLGADKFNMEATLAKMGVGKFTYDENGVITNYRTIMEAARRKAAQSAEGSEERATYEALLETIDQYDETRELIRDINNQIDDTKYKIQDANYTILTETLNNNLEITNDLLKAADFNISLLADDWTKMAEVAALMVGKDGKGGQLGGYQTILEQYVGKFKIDDDSIQSGYVGALQEALAAGKISEADYVQGLRESRDAIYEQITAITDLDKEMLEYYGNTLAKANEEIGKYMDRMDNLNGVLEHYSSILKLIGKQKDYEKMGLVLSGITKNRENQLTASKETYEFYKKEVADRQKAYEDAVTAGGNNTEQLELLKRQWDDAVAAQSDAYNEMLENTEAWAEATKAEIENTMEAAAASLENALTGGTTFDFLNTQLDHTVSIQEEYLTTTNKIYETTKLMRTAQQAIDASTNNTTKQKLKNFITETQQLQDQTELSKYELEIQQAKYDLLLAEIALEDAQNAKSMVRLKRDSEGNFGYVYTADANQVGDAEQKLADAENNLYNIALRGAEDYTTKSIELRQKLWEDLQELDEQRRNGDITSEEEYLQRKDEIVNYYNRKLADYSKLYSVAVETDARVIDDSWSTTYVDITTDSEQWYEATTKHLEESAIAWDKWSEMVDTVESTTGLDLASLAGQVEDIKIKSEELKTEITGEDGLIDAFTELLNGTKDKPGIKDITDAYGLQRDALVGDKGLVPAMQAAITKIGELLDAEKELKDFDVSNLTNPGDIGDGHTDYGTMTDVSYTGIRATFVGDKLPNGAPLTEQKKKDYGLNGILTVTGQELINGETWYTVKGSNGQEIGSFPMEYLKLVTLFDTGGYTGAWGPEGKLAMLHEKELVLNPEDTLNILNAVDMVHKILDMIDLQALSAQLGGSLSVPGYRDSGNGTLEQNVHIEASFPNVSDQYEIEQAFNTLINQASQYANRK